MKIDGVSAIAVIVIVAFAIERMVTGVLFALSFFKFWTRTFPDPMMIPDAIERAHAEKKQKLIYFVLASLLGVLFARYGGVRIFEALGFTNIPVFLDTVVTALIWVAGSARIAAIVHMPG